MTNYEIKIHRELKQCKKHYQQHMKTISIANKDQIQNWIEKQQYNKEIEIILPFIINYFMLPVPSI